MRATLAISELKNLRDEAADPLSLKPSEAGTAWRSRVESVLSQSLGSSHHITHGFKRIKYSLPALDSNASQQAFDRAFIGGVAQAVGQIEAAVYELSLLQPGDEPVDEQAYDPDLWSHVRVHVEDEDWGKVASQVATFVEDRIRTWSGHPKDRNGNDLVGKALYLYVLGDGSNYALGRQYGEREGWRFLGLGFAQALGTVDRHRLQDHDARRYAIGVLGLGSLLLTQLQHEHAEILYEG